jgi:hypothetical protein
MIKIQSLPLIFSKKGMKLIFPPDMIPATFLPLNLGSLMIAANTIAPVSYTTIFILSAKSLAA